MSSTVKPQKPNEPPKPTNPAAREHMEKFWRNRRRSLYTYRTRPWRPRSRKPTLFDYKGRQWEALRNFSYERAGFRCEWPGCTTRWPKIHAHHIETVNQAPDKAYDPNNVEVMCYKHHAMKHGWNYIPGKWREPQEANPDQFVLDIKLPDPWQLAADIHDASMRKK